MFFRSKLLVVEGIFPAVSVGDSALAQTLVCSHLQKSFLSHVMHILVGKVGTHACQSFWPGRDRVGFHMTHKHPPHHLATPPTVWCILSLWVTHTVCVTSVPMDRGGLAKYTQKRTTMPKGTLLFLMRHSEGYFKFCCLKYVLSRKIFTFHQAWHPRQSAQTQDADDAEARPSWMPNDLNANLSPNEE